jgi:GT2 family glycosyltransferase
VTRDVVALVLTFRRPRLATRSVRWLIDDEGFAPRDVVLVVNGDGGLDDPTLEAQVEILRLPENLGPAGGFSEGLRHVARTRDAAWIYVCEDDIALYRLPAPRSHRTAERADRLQADGGVPVGAVVAYGADLDDKTGRTHPHLVDPSVDLEEIGMGQWGATLLSREVLDAGVFPDETLFWGYEDLEYWLQVREAGFRVMVDTASAAAVHDQVTRPARTSWKGVRPNRKQEPWTRYYEARNFFLVSRRHGHWRWSVGHVAKSVRRFQLAPSRVHRRAIVDGFVDGVRGRRGRHPSYVRERGEL